MQLSSEHFEFVFSQLNGQYTKGGESDDLELDLTLIAKELLYN